MKLIQWEDIAACLREELVAYGYLLRLFEQQQQFLFERDASAVLQLGNEIEAQARSVGETRVRRELAVAEFAESIGQPTTSTLRSLLPSIQVDARPLVEALINEVNLLLHRVRRTSRHNHSLLSRAVEVQQETLQLLRPNSFTRTYSPAGRVNVAAAHGAGTLRVAG
jgi:flagellar biosynthesis/type III secretory pathway chaperone